MSFEIKSFNSLFETIMKDGTIEVYHGDDFNTTFLNPKLMNNGNNQEGIGIYFSDHKSTAESYGKDVVKAYIDRKNFIKSRESIKIIGKNNIINILKDMMIVDKEAMFYLVTDYGVYLENPEDLEDYHLEELYELIFNEEARNFQITMANSFGVVEFVKSWNKNTNIDGTYYNHNNDEVWYSLINTDIKLYPV